MMYFTAETPGADPAALPLRARRGRGADARQVGDDALAPLLVRRHRPPAADLPQGRQRPVAAATASPSWGERRATSTLQLSEDERISRDVALEIGPQPQLIVSRAGVLTFANLTARTLFGTRRGQFGRPFQRAGDLHQPAELRGAGGGGGARAPPRVGGRGRAARRPRARSAGWRSRSRPLLSDGARRSAADRLRGRRRASPPCSGSSTANRRDLELAYEELQSTIDELETTNEELQSANEELQTTNEELQSTNEELETMNEELQSTNEELETINDELRERTGELNRSTSSSRRSSPRSGSPSRCWTASSACRCGTSTRRSSGACARTRRWTSTSWRSTSASRPSGSRRRCGAPRRQRDGRRSCELEAVNRRGRAIMCRTTVMPLHRGRRRRRGRRAGGRDRADARRAARRRGLARRRGVPVPAAEPLFALLPADVARCALIRTISCERRAVSRSCSTWTAESSRNRDRAARSSAPAAPRRAAWCLRLVDGQQ